jgi:hypothetical protein
MTREGAYAFALDRIAAEMAAHKKRCSEISRRHGLEPLKTRIESLRLRLDELRETIKRTPAKTIFGVGVRMTTLRMGGWEEDYRETLNSTLTTVSQLSGTDFLLPTIRTSGN